MKNKTVLITGCAGFIGFSLSKYLLKKKFTVLGIDSLNNYYNLKLKKKRIKLLKSKKFHFIKIDISQRTKFFKEINKKKFDHIIHLSAQPGVRYSLLKPESYITNNIVAFSNILDLTKQRKLDLIYASSSSVYGDSKKFPIKEDFALKAQNIYALTKIQNEQQAELYSKLYKLRIIGLRFFTVFGEWGRPDMFLIKFFEFARMKKIFPLFNSGNHYRDFTYINDVISMVYPILLKRKKLKKKHNVFNICSGKPIYIKNLLKFLIKISSYKKIKNFSNQKIETYKTHGDNLKIKKFSNFKTFTNFDKAIKKTYEWYLNNKNLFF